MADFLDDPKTPARPEEEEREGALPEDEFHYDIQLTNKQLIFYFLAGATGLILAFLAGVMVGKGADSGKAGDLRNGRGLRDEPVVAVNEEPSPLPAGSPGRVESLTYAQRLDSEKPPEDTLQTGRPAGPGRASATPGSKPPGSPAAGVSPRPAAAATPVATPVVVTATRPTPARAAATKAPPAARPTPAPKLGAPGTLTIQVGAYKDKASAEGIMTRLKAKGYHAYVVAPAGAGTGLFSVRVGAYTARVDAEQVKARLEEREKFKPYIVTN